MSLSQQYPNGLDWTLSEIKDEIECCVVIREEKQLRDSCEFECELYSVCKRAYGSEE